MRKNITSSSFFAGLLLTVGVVSVATPACSADIVGVWYDDTGKGAVEIKPCGPRLCGNIVWLKEPISTRTGQPLVDANNPDANKRAQPICGLQILGNLAPQGDGSYDSGWVYDPKVGKSYDAAIEPSGADQLTLIGYKGVRLFSKSFTWRRAPTNLPRCTSTAAAVQPGNTGAQAAPMR